LVPKSGKRNGDRRGRYEFHGTGKDRSQAVVTAVHLPRREVLNLPAERFLRDPEQYGLADGWGRVDVESQNPTRVLYGLEG
jgi:hypothetical protein